MSEKISYSLPLFIASDHAGFALKQQLKIQAKLNWKDLGCFNSRRTDYTDWADKLCKKMQNNMFGVLICGTGQGMCMRANRYPQIRAALCGDKNMAQFSRKHNKANVLCLAGRFLSFSQALKILLTFLTTDFENNQTYEKRIKKLSLRV